MIVRYIKAFVLIGGVVYTVCSSSISSAENDAIATTFEIKKDNYISDNDFFLSERFLIDGKNEIYEPSFLESETFHLKKDNYITTPAFFQTDEFSIQYKNMIYEPEFFESEEFELKDNSFIFIPDKYMSSQFDISDKIPPRIEVTGNPLEWIRGDVLLNVVAKDNTYVKDLLLPNGETILEEPFEANVLIFENGEYIFSSSDIYGNKSFKTVKVTKIDNINPFFEFSVKPDDFTNKSVNIRFKGIDLESGVKEIVLPNNTVIESDTGSYEVFANGSYKFKVIDNVGNSFVETIDISNIDKIPPTITLDSSPKHLTKHSVNILVDVFDEGPSGIKEILLPDGNRLFGVSEALYEVSENGIYSFKSIDNAGNESVESITISNIDNVKPEMEFNIEPETWTNSKVTINVSAHDALSGLRRITLPDGNWVYDKNISYEVLANGVYKFEAEDNVGNTSFVNITVSNIDKIAPSDISILKNPSKEWSNSDVTISLVDNGDNLSGVDYMEYSINGGDWTRYSEPFVINKEGTHIVEGRAFDRAGNQTENNTSIDVSIDMTPPTVNEIELNDGDTYTNERNVTFEVEAFDSDSGLDKVMISTDNINWVEKPYSKEQNFKLPDSEGLHTVYVKVTDKAGNESPVVSDSIILDTLAPVVDLSINDGAEFTDDTNVKLTINYVEEGSGIDWIKIIEEGSDEYYLPSEFFTASPIEINWLLEPGFNKKVSVVIKDKAGNISNVAMDTILVDKLQIEEFTLENVVNPAKYNPFIPEIWAFEPKEMLAGTWIDFSAKIDDSIFTDDANDRIFYRVDIENISGYNRTLTGSMTKNDIFGFRSQFRLPDDVPSGSRVYVSLTARRELISNPSESQEATFPSTSGSRAQIGFTSGNINEAIRFNEVN